MRPKFTFLLLALCGFFAFVIQIQAAKAKHHHLMGIVSKKLPGIQIFDADTQELICEGHTGISPHEAAFSLDGKYVYVPVYGSTGVGQPGTDEHLVHFFRTSDCKDVGTLDTGANKRPHGIAVGKSGTVYLTTEISESILLIDPKERRIITQIPTGSRTSHMLAVTADEKKVYVSNVQSKTVSQLDVPDRKLAQVIQTGAPNQRMTLSPDEKWFVTNLGSQHEIAFYRTADNQLDFTISIAGSPFVSQFSADGKYLYNAGSEHGQLRAWKIDMTERKVVATTTEPIGRSIGSLAVNPFTGQVYVSGSDIDQVNEIDPDSWTVKKTLPTAQTPDCMIFATVR